MKSLQIFPTISHALKVYETNWRMYLGMIITMTVVTGFLTLSSFTIDEFGYVTQSALVALLAAISGFVLQIGIVETSLAFVRGNKVAFNDLYKNITLTKGIVYLVSSVLMVVVTMFGFLLIIIPGIFLSIALMFSAYAAIDKGVDPIESLFFSNRIVMGSWWKMFGLIFVLTIFNILGFFAFVLGLLLTIPVSMLAIADAYNQLESKEFRVQERE